jgi:hypothetical protein
MNARLRTVLLSALLLSACDPNNEPADAAAKRQIEAGMNAIWDKPDAPLQVGPTVIAQDYALADWTQGGMGGRALLQRRGQRWETILCAGDGIRDATGLTAVGVPDATARLLAEQLAAAEKHVSAERLRLMASFHGVVRMPATGGAPHER